MKAPGARLDFSVLGAGLIALFFSLVYFLEPLILHRDRTFLVQDSGPKPLRNLFTLESRFPIISTGGFKLNSSLKDVSLNELLALGKKKKILINFWATWCDPCIEEIPSLNMLALQLQQNKSNDLPLLVTISVDESSEQVKKLEKSFPHSFQFIVLHDPDGAWSKSQGIFKFPETFLIDREGKLLFKWIGPQDWLSLESIQLLSRA